VHGTRSRPNKIVGVSKLTDWANRSKDILHRSGQSGTCPPSDRREFVRHHDAHGASTDAICPAMKPHGETSMAGEKTHRDAFNQRLGCAVTDGVSSILLGMSVRDSSMKRNKKRSIFLRQVVTAAILTAAAIPAGAQAQTKRPLKLYWSADRGDNFSTATQVGENSAIEAGYIFARNEANVFATRTSGMVPLKLYWNSQRGDNFSTATAAGEQSALDAGYSFARIEGYVYADQRPNTKPLKLYWSSGRADNFTTGTSAGEHDALAAGYTFVRIEGYAPTTSPLPQCGPDQQRCPPGTERAGECVPQNATCNP
jgi:hypothetical protein